MLVFTPGNGLDQVEEALKALLESGKAKGYVTYNQIVTCVPDISCEQKKDQLLILLDGLEIELIEIDEATSKFCPGCRKPKLLMWFDNLK